jgi:hypothetical protein
VIDSLVFDKATIDDTYGNVSVKVSILDEKGEKRPLSLETPWMKAFVGVSKYEAPGPNSRPKYKLPVSFNRLDDYSRQEVFKRFFEALDEKLVNEGFENSATWLKRSGEPKAVIKAFYSAGLSYSKDKQGMVDDRYPPKLQFKLGTYPNDDGSVRFAAPVYQDKETRLDDVEDAIQKGGEVKAIIDCSGVWGVNGKFGLGWRVAQLKVKERKNYNSYAFCDESDGEDTKTLDDENTPTDTQEEPDLQLQLEEDKPPTPPASPKKRRGTGKRAAAKSRSKAKAKE